MVDHLGRIVDGDQLLYVIARALQESRRAARAGGRHRDEQPRARGRAARELASNSGAPRSATATCCRCCAIRGGMLGGETSGHILCLDKTTTGDGLVCALQVLAVMKQTGRSLAELASGMRKFPQVLLNVKVAERFDPSAVPLIQEAVARIEQRMAGEGRVVLRRLRYRAGDPRHGRGARRGRHARRRRGTCRGREGRRRLRALGVASPPRHRYHPRALLIASRGAPVRAVQGRSCAVPSSPETGKCTVRAPRTRA